MEAPLIRTAYGPKSNPSQKKFDKSLTKQSMKKDSDINYIVERFQKTGVVNHVSKMEAIFGDFETMNYQESLNNVMRANEMFLSIPSDIRKDFDNDPEKFIEFCLDEKNKEKLVEYGLASWSKDEIKRRDEAAAAEAAQKSAAEKSAAE